MMESKLFSIMVLFLVSTIGAASNGPVEPYVLGGEANQESIHLSIIEGASLEPQTVYLNTTQLATDANIGLVTIPVHGQNVSIWTSPRQVQSDDLAEILVGENETIINENPGFMGTYFGFTVTGEITRVNAVPGYFQTMFQLNDVGTITVETVLPITNPELAAHHVYTSEPQEWVPSHSTTDMQFAKQTYAAERNTEFVSNNQEFTIGDFLASLLTVPQDELGISDLTDSDPVNSIWFEVMTFADSQFYNQGTSTSCSRMTSAMNNADTVYYNDLKIGFTHRWCLSHTSSSIPSTATQCSTLLDDWISYIRNGNYPQTSTFYHRDFDVLFSHRELWDYDSNNNQNTGVAGCAYEDGMQSTRDKSYSLVQTKGASSNVLRVIIEHEVGHIFSGNHDAADTWSAWQCFGCQRGTIMASKVPTQPQHYFTGGDDYNANEWRIRYCAENLSHCSSIQNPDTEPTDAIATLLRNTFDMPMPAVQN